jgi:serine/threonine-protein kinase
VARVYLAEDTRDGRRVSLKILGVNFSPPASLVASFRRETEVAARLNHPGIPRFYEAGEHDGVFYIAREHVEGCPLREQILSHRKSDESRIEPSIRIMEEVARILHAAHEAGMIHRGVSSRTIMISEDGRVVLLDFGVVPEENLSGLPNYGMGNPSYLAPEALTSWAGTDRRVDVYSLGVSLFESLTLERPFSGHATSLVHAIQYSSLPDPRHRNRAISRDLHAVLETAMAKDPDRRYQTALEFAEDLRRVREGRPVLARREGFLRRISRWVLGRLSGWQRRPL